MSKSNEIKSKNSQSFNERICDDLAEILLQYLSIEEKVKLEKVCQLFQRNIYLKVFELNLEDGMFWWENNGDESFNLNRFATLVKKCPNIKSLEITTESYDHFRDENIVDDYNRIIQIVINYCHNLSQIECSFSLMSNQIRYEFIEKFGSNLTHFRALSYTSNDILNSFPNIQELDLNFDGYYSGGDEELYLPRLKKLIVYYRADLNAMPRLLTKVLKNTRRIVYLKIKSKINDPWQVISILDLISKNPNLVELKFTTRVRLNQEQFAHSIKQMANNCLTWVELVVVVVVVDVVGVEVVDEVGVEVVVVVEVAAVLVCLMSFLCLSCLCFLSFFCFLGLFGLVVVVVVVVTVAFVSGDVGSLCGPGCRGDY